MTGFDKIEFNLWGLELQEPMALITNWLIAFFCFYAFSQIKKSEKPSVNAFRSFYLVLGISMILGGLGHLLFKYFGFYGKYPSWILGTLAGYYVARGLLYYWERNKSYPFFKYFLIFKSSALLLATLISLKFVFIAIDVSITYIVYAGYIAYRLWTKDRIEMKFFVYGVLVLFPSLIIYALKIDLHRYFNREDLSHVFMLACIMLFYTGIRRISLKYVKSGN